MHQAAVALFTEEVGELKLTPVQYAALQTICNTPGIDQTTLAKAIAFDTSTINGVIDRLEARGLLSERNASATDKRVRLINSTAQGQCSRKRFLRSALKRACWRHLQRKSKGISAPDAVNHLRRNRA